ncbi:MAG: COG4223 family protein [Alphaproteobacteria bacterium]
MTVKSKKAMDNASDIIERFGGIRPMSHKTDIPVTTIQGWKKRNSIPAGRYDQIVSAAREHDVDLSGLVENGGANSNDKADVSNKADNQITEDNQVSSDKDGTQTYSNEGKTLKNKEVNKTGPADKPHANDDYQTIRREISDMEGKAVKKSVLISAALFIVVLGGIAALLWPKAESVNETVQNNAEQLANIESRTGETGSGINARVTDLMPESWQNQIDGWMNEAEQIKQDALNAKEQAQAALQKVEEISGDVLGPDAGTMGQRVEKLEGHYQDVMATSEMTYFMDKLRSMGASIPGQNMLGSAQNELNSVLSSFSGTPEQLDGYLDQARQQSSALGQTFEGVPADDMKAAALLFTFNQMRAALNREGQPFEEDLVLLKNFVGQDNTELHTAIDRLAPRAKDGVLSVEGLSNEFRDVAGDAVVASLKGEDVSVQEKAKARFNELFSVEKDGELVTGTETQMRLNEINNLLEDGNLDEAIAKADLLEGPEAEIVQPWIEKAKATQAAQEMSNILGYNIDLRTMDNIEGMENPEDTIPVEPGNMIYDPKSGLRIYIPSETVIVQ